MFLVLFGATVRYRTVGGGTFHCPACGVDRTYLLREARRWVTIFLIPMVPAQRLGAVVECAECHHRFDQQTLAAPTMGRAASELSVARRVLLAFAVEASGNTTVAREAAIDLMRRQWGEAAYDGTQLDIDRTTSDQARALAWVAQVRPMLSTAGAESLLHAAVWVATADGVLDPAEEEAVGELGEALALTPMHVEGVVAHVSRTMGHREV